MDRDEHALEPLRSGAAVDFRPPAWVERGRPGSITVPGGTDVVWVEGTGIIRHRLAPLLDASVWIQVDRHEAEDRLLARDGSSPAQLQLIEDWDREERPPCSPRGRGRTPPSSSQSGRPSCRCRRTTWPSPRRVAIAPSAR